MSSNHVSNSMPPLRTLQVFEAAARHQSFTAAGREIGITQSAVSRQIADLEAYLKQELFIRSGPRLSLTRVGETLAQGLSYALADMQRSVMEARNVADSRVVTLSMLPSVAAKWLAPQLGLFIQKHPDIDLRVSATRHLVDFAAEGIDAAIRYGNGEWPGAVAVRLGTEKVQPICTPEYAHRMNLKTPADLLRATLFWGDIEEDWRKWFTAAGVSKIEASRGPKLGDDTAILQAVIEHQGVALGRSLLTKTDLETGRLIAPFPVMLEASYSYWLVSPAGHEEGQSLAAVKDWIIGAFVE